MEPVCGFRSAVVAEDCGIRVLVLSVAGEDRETARIAAIGRAAGPGNRELRRPHWLTKINYMTMVDFRQLLLPVSSRMPIGRAASRMARLG